MYNVFVAWRESRARSATLSAIVLKRVLRLLRIGVCVVLALAVRPAMSAEPETAASLGTPPAVTPEPNGTQKPRFISFVVPPSGTLTALRVTLVTLNRPRFCCTDATAASCSNTRCDNNVQCISAPNLVCAHGSAPGGAPNYDCFEGETRL